MKCFVAWLGLLLLAPICALGQVFGTVDAFSGPVSIVSVDGTTTTPALGQKLWVGQTLQTRVNGELHVVTEDGGLLALRPSTTFKMVQYQASQDSKALIDMSLVRGALRSITGWIGKFNAPGYRISTSTATVGIRGTDHEVTVVEASVGHEHGGTYDSVMEGATVVRSAHGELQLQAGQHGFAAMDAQTPPRLLAQPPEFLGQRVLHLEERIAERKRDLSHRVRQVLDEHPDAAKAVRERLDNVSDEQRETARKRLLRRPPKRSGD